MQRLKNKVAVVSGASRGAGRGIALVLGEEGSTVYITGRSVRYGPQPPPTQYRSDGVVAWLDEHGADESYS